MNKKPYTCPVCNGTGLVPNGFYNNIYGFGVTSDLTPETCRSCTGTGLVWDKSEDNTELVFDGSNYIPVTFTIKPPLTTPDIIIK